MINFDEINGKSQTEHNPNWSHISDYPYRTLKIGSSGLGKTNALLNLISH